MKKNTNSIARERIKYLFTLIDNIDKDISESAIKMIKKIRTKYNIRLHQNEKEKFCKFCNKPYDNSKIRMRTIKKDNKKYLQKIVICDNCGKEQRYTFDKA